MRLLVVIPHYFGPRDPLADYTSLGSTIEPIARIAALNETIVSLHRNFGPLRNTYAGDDIAPPDGASAHVIDIIIVTKRDNNVLPDLGIAPETYSIVYFDGPPTLIPFQAKRLMRARADQYDFYCYLEDDIAIHDPDFFAKQRWFQDQFGPQALLAPTRVETGFTGTPGKVVIDPQLPDELAAPFRRDNQRENLQAVWHGVSQVFAMPANAHAAAFFLTPAQLNYWIAQPSFDDDDMSWVGPLESAATLGIGKVFDIYKSVTPDPFFLEVHHFGTVYASRHPPAGRRYGEPPLLAIAQNAVRALGAVQSGALVSNGLDVSGMQVIGTVTEQMTRLSDDNQRLETRSRSLKWLAGALFGELLRRVRKARPG